ncbi:MAG TPA: dihydropteroate synthase-like protein [Methanocorpusculum sp.]|nr:dihydropteroate synthase-like protein [Methanocorpusculum sp.]
MHVLFPTGRQSADTLASVLKGISGFTHEILITGEIASFLSPAVLSSLLAEHHADCVVVSGMCTADFSAVEKEWDVPIYRGTRHAADMRLCIPLLLSNKLSKSQPADMLLDDERRKEAEGKLLMLEKIATYSYEIRHIKFGKTSRIKVLAEIMDAHRHPTLREAALQLISHGADGVDLGFGFDATPEDVKRCFTELSDLDCILSIDTQNPDLIRASLFRADIVFSVTASTLPLLAKDLKKFGTVVVAIPQEGTTLDETVRKIKDAGINQVFADPLLQPPLSGMTESLASYLPEYGAPKVMGCVNVTELIDADSPGVCALLAASAAETHCAAVLVSEHSDKTSGACAEMRRAVDMMQLSRDRPYPKDVGYDVFSIKEKRKRREPVPKYDSIRDVEGIPENLSFDPRGSFRIGVENGKIVAVRRGHAIRGTTAEEVFTAILAEDGVSLLDHAGYLGKELYKAELSIRFGRSFEQDGPF